MKRSVLLFAACLLWPAAAFSQTKPPSAQEFVTKVATWAAGKSMSRCRPPSTQSNEREIDELKANSGQEFDRAYNPMQVKAHEQAVQLFEAYARDGDNPDLKAWAGKTLPHLKQHLAMAKNLVRRGERLRHQADGCADN